MVTLPSVKVAMQPLSQKVPMERRAVLRPGKMCAFLAARGMLVQGRSAVGVEVITSPLGILIGRGTATICLLVHGLESVRKFPVVPESAKADSVTFATKLTLGLIKLICLIILLALGVAAAVGRHSSHPLFHCDPPMMSALVAAVL